MIVAQARLYLRNNPAERSLCAALQAMIAYGRGLEKSQITVSMADGRILLSGEVDTLDAYDTAVVIAEVFTGRPVMADLAVKPGQGLRRARPANPGLFFPIEQNCA